MQIGEVTLSGLIRATNGKEPGVRMMERLLLWVVCYIPRIYI